MKIGTKLATKDGRIIGNAIVVEQRLEFWVIETDFGNRTTLSEHEIDNWFHIGMVTDLGRWLNDRELVRCVRMT